MVKLWMDWFNGSAAYIFPWKCVYPFRKLSVIYSSRTWDKSMKINIQERNPNKRKDLPNFQSNFNL